MLPLAPEVVAAAYDFLRACPPFKTWKLPPADEVQFHITKHNDRAGDHNVAGKEHIIRVSMKRTTTTDSLIQVVAHEMLHMRQTQTKTARGRSDHNWRFMGLARQVCRIHGWNLETFLYDF